MNPAGALISLTVTHAKCFLTEHSLGSWKSRSQMQSLRLTTRTKILRRVSNVSSIMACARCDFLVFQKQLAHHKGVVPVGAEAVFCFNGVCCFVVKTDASFPKGCLLSCLDDISCIVPALCSQRKLALHWLQMCSMPNGIALERDAPATTNVGWTHNHILCARSQHNCACTQHSWCCCALFTAFLWPRS